MLCSHLLCRTLSLCWTLPFYAGRYPSMPDVPNFSNTSEVKNMHKMDCVKLFRICMNCLLSLLSSALIFRSDCTFACCCLRFLRFRRGFSLFFRSQEFFLNWFYLGTRWNTWKLALRSMSLIQKSATDRVTFLWASRTITFPSYIGNWGRGAKTMKRTLTSITRVCYVETGDLTIFTQYALISCCFIRFFSIFFISDFSVIFFIGNGVIGLCICICIIFLVNRLITDKLLWRQPFGHPA